MPNKIIIDKTTLSDPEVLADCKVGDTKQFTITAKVTRDDQSIFEADVTDLEYGDIAAGSDESYTSSPGEEEISPAPGAKNQKAKDSFSAY